MFDQQLCIRLADDFEINHMSFVYLPVFTTTQRAEKARALASPVIFKKAAALFPSLPFLLSISRCNKRPMKQGSGGERRRGKRLLATLRSFLAMTCFASPGRRS